MICVTVESSSFPGEVTVLIVAQSPVGRTWKHAVADGRRLVPAAAPTTSVNADHGGISSPPGERLATGGGTNARRQRRHAPTVARGRRRSGRLSGTRLTRRAERRRSWAAQKGSPGRPWEMRTIWAFLHGALPAQKEFFWRGARREPQLRSPSRTIPLAGPLNVRSVPVFHATTTSAGTNKRAGRRAERSAISRGRVQALFDSPRGDLGP